MELLALPPFHTDGSVNPYNIAIVGVADIEDVEYAGFVRGEQWVDGTRAGGGGVEFYIPRGCEPRGPVRNCTVHRHAFDHLPIWP